ncbi:DUF1150 family protein [Acidimangrovimonas sediminis]|uniref:DUF1150 family protein n=1 Tax=Acidimangrovimonas sediminis TaxID=2056283 RepID=UPI000C7F9C3F|nr:DUF1150 domain-containing protein [Acidimangrovimonas sediminis]
MNTQYEFEHETGARPIVYVRPVAVDTLPDEIREQADGLDTLYAVHGADGERIALVRDRRLAFALARQNDMTPVNVH